MLGVMSGDGVEESPGTDCPGCGGLDVMRIHYARPVGRPTGPVSCTAGTSWLGARPRGCAHSVAPSGAGCTGNGQS